MNPNQKGTTPLSTHTSDDDVSTIDEIRHDEDHTLASQSAMSEPFNVDLVLFNITGPDNICDDLILNSSPIDMSSEDMLASSADPNIAEEDMITDVPSTLNQASAISTSDTPMSGENFVALSPVVTVGGRLIIFAYPTVRIVTETDNSRPPSSVEVPPNQEFESGDCSMQVPKAEENKLSFNTPKMVEETPRELPNCFSPCGDHVTPWRPIPVEFPHKHMLRCMRGMERRIEFEKNACIALEPFWIAYFHKLHICEFLSVMIYAFLACYLLFRHLFFK